MEDSLVSRRDMSFSAQQELLYVIDKVTSVKATFVQIENAYKNKYSNPTEVDEADPVYMNDKLILDWRRKVVDSFDQILSYVNKVTERLPLLILRFTHKLMRC